MKDDEGRAWDPATANTTIDSSTKEAKVMIPEPTDKTAAVHNIGRVPSPFDISFAEARALAAIHGSYCDCHPAPLADPPARQQSRGAA